VKTRDRLAEWVRKLGISHPEIRPQHAFRHSFKQIADRHEIPERVSDYITGHSPATVGRGYGAPTLGDMAAALKRFPHYEVGGNDGNHVHSKHGGNDYDD
jgi:integrase